MSETNVFDNLFDLLVISENALYKESFEEIEEISLVVAQPLMREDIDCHAIFLDGETVHVSDLANIRAMYGDIPIFYRMANVQNTYLLQNIIITCNGHEIIPVNEMLTMEQMKDFIAQKLFQSASNKKRRIVSFFGTHSGAGVSTTILNVADLLAKRIDGRVLVLSLNPWDPSDYFLPYKGLYLNDLKIDLHTRSLTDKRLLSSVHQYPDSFYHLAGNRDIKQQRYFSSDEIDYLLTQAHDLFDVVLVDGGTHFDNACYGQSFLASTMRFLVSTQEPKGYQGYWPHIYEQLLQPLGAKTHDFAFVLNRYAPLNELGTEKDIAEELNMSLITTIPDEGALGSSAITQKRLLSENGVTREYTSALAVLVRAIQHEYELKEKDSFAEEAPKSLFAKLIPRKKAKA